MGVNALSSNASGASNIAIGDSAAAGNTSGSFNTIIGDSAGQNIITASNVICIGANVAGADVSNSCFIGSIFGQTSSGGTAVFIDGSGRLGTTTSSRRFKEEIKPMQQASEALYSLKPVTFRYKKEIDSAGTSQFGLVAEDVEKVNPDLVVCDKEGKPYSVRYDQVNAMLLNEFLKAHRKMEEQDATIARQQKQIEALTAGLQKVSDQLEASKPAPRTVAIQ
jgi:trimeric autotransporter adhesin